MSTHDVPGANPKNHDELAAGCWAEARDGSLVLVESTEDDRVIFSMFDLAQSPIAEWRSDMRIGAFKRKFSWLPSDPDSEQWSWHDKTPFPWDRVIRSGSRDGVRYATVHDQLSAAERARRSLEARVGDLEEPTDDFDDELTYILNRLQRAISRRPSGRRGR